MAGDLTTYGALKRILSNVKNTISATITGGSVNGTPIGNTTPSTGVFTNLTANGFFFESVASTVSAAGTNQATATVVSAAIADVTNVGSGTGIALGISDSVIGATFTVFSNGAHNLSVYPATSSGTIDGGSAGAAVTLTSTKRCQYTCIAANTWISSQLGVVSA